jgi:hypothetical protein
VGALRFDILFIDEHPSGSLAAVRHGLGRTGPDPGGYSGILL